MDEGKLELVNKRLTHTVPYYGGKYNYHFHCTSEKWIMWKKYFEECDAVKINFHCYQMCNGGCGCIAIDFSKVEFVGYRSSILENEISVCSDIIPSESGEFYFIFTVDTEINRKEIELALVDSGTTSQDIVDRENLQPATKNEKKELILPEGLLTKGCR